MKFDILYSRLDPVYWDRQERRVQSGICEYEQMGVPKFPYLSSNNGNFSKISFLFLYYNIKVEKSQVFDIFSATRMGSKKYYTLDVIKFFVIVVPLIRRKQYIISNAFDKGDDDVKSLCALSRYKNILYSAKNYKSQPSYLRSIK